MSESAVLKQFMTSAASYESGNKDIGVDEKLQETFSNTSLSVNTPCSADF